MPKDLRASDPDELLTTAQAAELLGRRRQTIRNYVQSGRLVPAQKLPASTGTYLFRRADVEALLPSPEAPS